MVCLFPCQVLLFVSSEFLKCRLLKWLLAHPMNNASSLRFPRSSRENQAEWRPSPHAPCHAMLRHTTLLHYSTPLHSTPLHSTPLHSTPRHTSLGGLQQEGASCVSEVPCTCVPTHAHTCANKIRARTASCFALSVVDTLHGHIKPPVPWQNRRAITTKSDKYMIKTNIK